MLHTPYLDVLLPTLHSEKVERWLWRAPVFGDIVVHCAVPRDSKLEKGSKKAPQLGFEPQMYSYASGVHGLDFHGFAKFSALGAKPGRNPILGMACFLEK